MTSPSSWTTFDEALAAHQSGLYGTAGVGIVLVVEDGYVGIDLDACRDPDSGTLAQWARDILDLVPGAYIDVSPTGTGAKAIIRGTWTLLGSKFRVPGGAFEVYARGRYFAITGHSLSAVGDITDGQAGLDRLAGMLQEAQQMTRRPARQRPAGNAPTAAPSRNGNPLMSKVIRAGGRPEEMSDDEVLAHARRCRTGPRFEALMRGDTSMHGGDASRADLELCALLRFSGGQDAARIDRLFRQSGLYRSKWDEARGEQTYGAMTVATAMSGEVYSPDFRSNGTAAEQGDPPGAAPGELPVILASPDLETVNNQAVAALANYPNLYQRGAVLARITRDRTPPDSRIRREDGAPRILVATRANLTEALSTVAYFCKETKYGVKRVPPPALNVACILDRGEWPELRYLTGVVESPALRPDGSIIDQPGYDPATGLLYEPNANFPEIPKAPTRDDARRAAVTLLDLVQDFEFAGLEHKAAWLSATLTPFARPAIAGVLPLIFFEASTAGAGKTLLADLVGIIATGRKLAKTEISNDNEETRKTLLTIGLEGDPIILFDNAHGSFGCSALDAALTAGVIKGRLLGASKTSGEVPLRTMFLGSGNNVAFRGDLHRRAIPCRLEPSVERPEERTGFHVADLEGHVHAHRPRYVAAALTILRAYFAAGCPQATLPHFGSFEDWSRLVRQAVYWATDVDPWETRASLTPESRGDVGTLATVLAGWSRLPGGDRAPGITAAHGLELLKSTTGLSQIAMKEALSAWAREGELPTPRELGNRLRAARGRVLGDHKLCSRIDPHTKVATWWAQPVGAGSAGSAVSDFPSLRARTTREEEELLFGRGETDPADTADPAEGGEVPF